MKVLGYALSEAERLYPPVANGPRGTTQPFTFHGYTVPAGQRVLYSVAASHLLPHVWREPERFDPDRFGPGRGPVDRFAFLPFGAGPRVCIGAGFALQEATIILATLLARFRWEVVPSRIPRPRMILTLRPEGGVWLRATPR